MQLQDKVCVITGGASGIGRGTVELFIEQGAKVVIGDLLDDKGAELERLYPGRAVYCRTDVSDEAQVVAMIDRAVDTFGGLDVLFNNAGVPGPIGSIMEVEQEAFDKAFGVLMRGVFLGTKHAAPHIAKRGGGSIINTGSTAVAVPGPALHAYSAAKAAVANFTRSTAMELGNANIRVNCICPGSIATPLFAVTAGLSHAEADKTLDTVSESLADWGAIPRAGKPLDIAQAALWFAGDQSTFVTGQILYVDGGRTVGMKWTPGADPSAPFRRVAGLDRDANQA